MNLDVKSFHFSSHNNKPLIEIDDEQGDYISPSIFTIQLNINVVSDSTLLDFVLSEGL